MQPQWHIYWRYAGNVGFAPTIKWTLPEGFTIGEIQWPNPIRIDDTAAGLVSYAYDDEVLLFAEITPPKNLEPGATITISTENDWLTCKTECIPGDSTNELELPVGEAKPSDHAALFDKFAAQVPVAAGDPSLPVEIEFQKNAATKPELKLPIEVEVKAKPPWALSKGSGYNLAAIYPAGAEPWDVEHPAPPAASGESGSGESAGYESMKFAWAMKVYDDVEPGEHAIVTALRLPMINRETGETKTFHARLDQRVTIEAGAKTPTASPGESEPQTTIAKTSAGATEFNFLNKDAAPRAQRSLPILLLFAFIGGLILNIMPCVLPVLSIKVLGFVQQAGQDPRRVLRMGLVFALGVVVSFWALASIVVGAKSSGGQIGWGFQLQEPRFVIAMSAVMFAFALSLFGLFTVELPGAAMQNLDSLQRREGPAGAFFNGVLATLLATPCTAPLLAPALGFAFSQTSAMIYVFFTAIALGLAAPYVLLAANPRLLKFVPKPGGWMETFKQIIGIPLVATVIWLLWVLGRTSGADGIIWTLCFLVLVGIACWMIGRTMESSYGAARRWTAYAIAGAIAVGGYFFFPERYLRAIGTSEAAAAPIASSVKTDGGLVWQPFSFDLVNELVAQNKTVFIDFTADWCWTCKVNENTVLKTEAVAAAFKEHEVELVIADYTRRDPAITRLLQQFGRAGVPMYLIFPAGKPQDYILLPEVLTPGIVKEALTNASGQNG
jgi:thiol:disulfide interchange protein